MYLHVYVRMCVHCDISGCSADIHLMHKCVVLSPYIDMSTCHHISISPHVTIYRYVHMYVILYWTMHTTQYKLSMSGHKVVVSWLVVLQ